MTVSQWRLNRYTSFSWTINTPTLFFLETLVNNILLQLKFQIMAAMTDQATVDRRSSLLIRKGSSTAACLMKELDDFDGQYQLGPKLGAGRFAQVFAATDKKFASARITLRIFAKSKCKLGDFLREYNASYFLSPHPNIVDTYEGLYATADFYFFAQEDQPTCNSLRELVDAGALAAGRVEHQAAWSAAGASPRMSISGPQPGAGGSPSFWGTGSACKAAVKDCSIVRQIIAQVVSAVEFMHNENLVHQNLTAENVLVFDARPGGTWKTKITDFGCTRQKGVLAKRRAEDDEDAWVLLYRAPELCDTLPKEGYCVDPAQDIWSLGILVYFALKGTYPWPQASIIHKSFYDWDQYTRRKTHQLPPKWSPFSVDGLKLFKHTLMAKPRDRYSIKELKKYLKDKWIKEVKSASDDDLYIIPASASLQQNDTLQHDASPSSSPNRLSSDHNTLRVAPCGGSASSSPHQLKTPSPRNVKTQKSKSISGLPEDYRAAAAAPQHHHSLSSARSSFTNWLSNTMSTMTEISEQIVSAAE